MTTKVSEQMWTGTDIFSHWKGPLERRPPVFPKQKCDKKNCSKMGKIKVQTSETECDVCAKFENFDQISSQNHFKENERERNKICLDKVKKEPSLG